MASEMRDVVNSIYLRRHRSVLHQRTPILKLSQMFEKGLNFQLVLWTSHLSCPWVLMKGLLVCLDPQPNSRTQSRTPRTSGTLGLTLPAKPNPAEPDRIVCHVPELREGVGPCPCDQGEPRQGTQTSGSRNPGLPYIPGSKGIPHPKFCLPICLGLQEHRIGGLPLWGVAPGLCSCSRSHRGFPCLR